MPCAKCGGTMAMEDSTGGTDTGRFKETYACVVCGAKGFVSGRNEEPAHEWDRWGSAYEQ